MPDLPGDSDRFAYGPVAQSQVRVVKRNPRKKKRPAPRELSAPVVGRLVDLTSSSAYPSLERKRGGPDNWVEKAGGLDPYLERIAKHLHYEEGMSISRAIASAWNTLRRWKKGGDNVKPETQAKAAKALANMEAKRLRGKS